MHSYYNNNIAITMPTRCTDNCTSALDLEFVDLEHVVKNFSD
jgi:hypothetical protein